MPKSARLSDVSALTMRATSTPILAIIARMAVNELESRCPVGYEDLAIKCRTMISELSVNARRKAH